ncbi:hypothetical protein GZ78_12770 [Endozoicomonas numazuensis]|uniref:Uncharacterized protein n=1 Tax=Endozoicomonas numazuensis TaxID=1137799 RepID=A0A081NIU8_9GAMM|nr:hypothetical protein GZ78_12770 [Endozoicomonas numazuensis]
MKEDRSEPGAEKLGKPEEKVADSSKEGTPQPNCCQTLCGWGSSKEGGSNGRGHSDFGEEKSLVDHILEHSIKSRVHQNRPSRVVSW